MNSFTQPQNSFGLAPNPYNTTPTPNNPATLGNNPIFGNNPTSLGNNPTSLGSNPTNLGGNNPTSFFSNPTNLGNNLGNSLGNSLGNNPGNLYGQSQQQEYMMVEGKPVYKAHIQQIYNALDAAYQNQADHNLRYLMYFLDLENQVAKETAERVCAYDESKDLERPDHTELVVERCNKAKKRNIRLLMRLMNVRSKLVEQMGVGKSRMNEREEELELIYSKIRDMRYEVTSKYNQLTAIQAAKREHAYPPPTHSC